MARLSDVYSGAYEEDIPEYEAPPENKYSNLGLAGYEQVGSYSGTNINTGSGGSLSPKSADEYAPMSAPASSGPVSSFSGPAVGGAQVAADDPVASFTGAQPGLYQYKPTSASLNTAMPRGSITQNAGSGVGVQQPKASISTRVSTQPMPTFKMPTYDESKIKKARQKKMGPMTRELRMAVQQALSKAYENPAVRNQAVEAALRGYGIGLERAAMGAEAAAQQEYNQQFARDLQSAQAAFTNAMNAWQGSQISVSTTTPFDINKQSDLEKIKTMFA